MNFVDVVLIYLLMSRLAILTAGVVSVFLGYKLFCRGIGASRSSGSDSTIESSVVGVRFLLKNTAPGTAFALFGAILIVVMLIQSSPSVTLETVSKWKASTESQQSETNEQAEKLVLRGNEQDSMPSLTAQGVEYEKRGDTANAERAYRKAVTLMAEPINDLAWLYVGSGRAKQAIGLATLAVQLRPDELRFADTLAKAKAAAK
jgi:tetratricopeptide (TPR) repeat protein